MWLNDCVVVVICFKLIKPDSRNNDILTLDEFCVFEIYFDWDISRFETKQQYIRISLTDMYHIMLWILHVCIYTYKSSIIPNLQMTP